MLGGGTLRPRMQRRSGHVSGRRHIIQPPRHSRLAKPADWRSSVRAVGLGFRRGAFASNVFHGDDELRFASAIVTSIQGMTVRAVLLGVLAASMATGGSPTKVSATTACPAGYNCKEPYQLDGACQHPATVFDESTKSARYESDPFSAAVENACLARTGPQAARRGGELRLKLGNGAAKLYNSSWLGQNEAISETISSACGRLKLQSGPSQTLNAIVSTK